MKTMKKETLEEAAAIGKFAEKKYLERLNNFQSIDFKDGVFEGAKWQQEQFKNESTANYIDRHIVEALVETAKQKRMFSEEELFTICRAFATFVQRKGPSYKKQQEWFDQFKKK